MLMSTYNKVYQSLANLIKWADYILINGDKSLNGEACNEIIKEVQEGIKVGIEKEIKAMAMS